MIWVYHLRPKICKNKINENYAYLLIFNIKQIKIVKIYNFLNLNCPDAVSLKNRKEIKIAEICNFLNSNCPDGFDSKVLKIQIFLGANCPDACNSKTHKTNYINFSRINFYAKLSQFWVITNQLILLTLT